MGKYQNGVNGAFSGKVGKAIGSSWKGIPYLKGPHKKRTKPPTEGEVINRFKFKLAQNFLKPMVDFVRVGFKNYTPTVEGFLAAKSWLMRNSFEGEYPDIKINPATVKLSHGTLPLPADIRFEKLANGDLKFFWNPEEVIDGLNNDQIMMIAYNISRGVAVYTPAGQLRKTGMDVLESSKIEGTKGTAHVYVAFVASDRSRQSDSVYLGEVTIE